jgi:hypothetical protein
MNGKKAKRLRKMVYGEDGSHRERKPVEGHEPQANPVHHTITAGGKKIVCFAQVPVCINGGKRRAYQKLKAVIP